MSMILEKVLIVSIYLGINFILIALAGNLAATKLFQEYRQNSVEQSTVRNVATVNGLIFLVLLYASLLVLSR